MTVIQNISSLLDMLFRQHNKELLSFAQRQPASHAAEDVTQEAYLRLMQHPNPSVIDNHRAYLFKTVSNVSINQYRYDQVRAKYHITDVVDIDTIVSSEPLPETHIDGILGIEKFIAALDELPTIYQHAFILSKLDGLAYDDVASSLGISTKTAQRYVLKVFQHCMRSLQNDF